MEHKHFDVRTLDHLASLSRLYIKGKEKKKLSVDIEKILEYIGRLKQADTSGVQALSGGSFLQDVMRKDGEGKCDTGEKERAVEQFPKSRGGFLEVPAVFE